MNDRIAPSGRATRVVRIVAVPKNGVLTALFCGRVRGMLTHRIRGETVACRGEGVEGAAVHRNRPVWKGYAPGRVWDEELKAWIPAVVEVTEHLDEILRPRDYVAEVWSLWRTDPGSKTSPVTGVFLERRAEAELVASFDVLPTLQRRYRCDELALDVANPVPARTVLPAVDAPRPAGLVELLPSPATPPTDEQKRQLREQYKRLGQTVSARNGAPRHG